MTPLLDIIVRADERLFLLINGHWWTPDLDSLMEEISALGAWPIGLIALALLAHDGRARLFRHVVLLIAVILGFGLCLRTLKPAVDRDRPAAHFAQQRASGEVDIRFVERRELTSNSMPSGHTATAFCLMVYCALLGRGNRAALLALACAIGYSRIYVGLHFPGDVLVGAALGSAWGWVGWRGYRFWAARRPLPPHTCTTTV